MAVATILTREAKREVKDHSKTLNGRQMPDLLAYPTHVRGGQMAMSGAESEGFGTVLQNLEMYPDNNKTRARERYNKKDKKAGTVRPLPKKQGMPWPLPEVSPSVREREIWRLRWRAKGKR